MVGSIVIHKKYGKGVVRNTDNGHLTIYFDKNKKEIKFVYPDAFDGFLRFERDNLQDKALDDLKNKQESLLAEKQKKQEERLKEIAEKPVPTYTIKERKRVPKKIPPRKNMAFKLNFCDGGASSELIGFKDVCSDSIIKYNIETAKHRWCSYFDCPCRKYLNAVISRKELTEIWKNDRVCYESATLLDWIAYAGYDLYEDGWGKPRRLPNAQLGSLAILTTRYPYDKEIDRIIVGVFIVDTAYEGDGTIRGSVSTKSKYKIAIRPEEAKKLRFWNYYRNEGNPDSIKWGTGLYRFVKDEDALRLLQDIVQTKEGKNDYALAKEILIYYMELHVAQDQ